MNNVNFFPVQATKTYESVDL